MHYEEASRKLPVREFDVVVAGGGTAGVVAAGAKAIPHSRTRHPSAPSAPPRAPATAACLFVTIIYLVPTTCLPMRERRGSPEGSAEQEPSRPLPPTPKGRWQRASMLLL